MVSVSVSVNVPLHHKFQKFSSGTGSPGWSQKKGCKKVVVWCGGNWLEKIATQALAKSVIFATLYLIATSV